MFFTFVIQFLCSWLVGKGDKKSFHMDDCIKFENDVLFVKLAELHIGPRI